MRGALGGQLCLATSRAWRVNRAALLRPRRRLSEAPSRLRLASASRGALAEEDGSKHPHGGGVKRGLAFQVLSGAYVLLAASASVAPDGQVALAVPGIVQATAAHALSDAAKHHRLGSDTYQRLASGLLLSSTATIAVAATSTAAHTVLPALIAGCTAAACVAAYRGKLRPLAGAPALWCMTTVKGLAAKTYAAFAACSAAFAAVLLCSPAWVLSTCGLAATAGRMELGRTLGAALVCHSVVMYALADAADRSRLGGTTFKHLNCACAAAATLGGALLVLAPGAFNTASGDGVPCMALALLQIVPASVCLFQYLTGVKVKTMKG
jgi:hypothetical protein